MAMGQTEIVRTDGNRQVVEILKSQFFRHPMQPSHTAAVHPAAVENFRSCGSSKIEGSQAFHATTTKLTSPKLGEPGEVNP